MHCRYLYTDVADVNGENALSLLYASKKYAINQLVRKCLTFITDGQTTDNVCSILEQAHFFNEEEFRTRALNYILQHAADVLMTSGFQELCDDCVKLVVCSDRLMCEEDRVLDAVTRWAEYKCQKSGKEGRPEMLRGTLGDILYLVRFPLLDKEYFTNVVSDSALLNDAEKVQLFKYFYRSDATEAGLFKTRKRDIGQAGNSEDIRSDGSTDTSISAVRGKDSSSIQTCMRFSRVSIDDSWYCGDHPDAIAFQSNVDVCLHGILVYGCAIGESIYNVQTAVYDDSDTGLVTHDCDINTSEYQQTYAILFNSALHLKHNRRYTVTVKMGDANDMDTYEGVGGQTNVTADNGVKFTFFKSRRSANGTDVKIGQIPGLLFSKEGS